MKKTLILIASLSFGTAVSQAAELGIVTFERSSTASGDSVSLDSISLKMDSGYGLSVSSSDAISNFSRSSSTDNDLLIKGDIPTTVFSPNANVGNSNGQWKVSFTFHNSSGQNMLISSIDLSMVGFTSAGKPQFASGNNMVAMPAGADWIGGTTQQKNKPVNLTLGVSGQTDQMLVYNATTTDSGSNGTWDGIRTGNYNYENFVLGADQNLILTITASNNSLYTNGTFAGLTGIKINGELVPEPATASLGLLGLAALAMRRRRA